MWLVSLTNTVKITGDDLELLPFPSRRGLHISLGCRGKDFIYEILEADTLGRKMLSLKTYMLLYLSGVPIWFSPILPPPLPKPPGEEHFSWLLCCIILSSLLKNVVLLSIPCFLLSPVGYRISINSVNT